MTKAKNVIIVIAEGQSEIAYLSELNRFLREEEIGWVFYPVKAVNGQYREVRKTYNQVWKKNRKARIEILVDRDIYIREPGERDDYRQRKNDGLPYFRFSYMNFEDFLIMHLGHERAKRWCSIASEYGHNVIPLAAKEYIALMHSSRVWGRTRYKKGAMPFEIDYARLRNLIRNDSDRALFIHSDFTDVIIEVIPSLGLKQD